MVSPREISIKNKVNFFATACSFPSETLSLCEHTQLIAVAIMMMSPGKDYDFLMRKWTAIVCFVFNQELLSPWKLGEKQFCSTEIDIWEARMVSALVVFCEIL